ncbi:MAG: hypothetical protein IH624_15905 [Phycisphaerae bacterium]|nr:hypothetical protein [Phycisphaerae bacterium]
MSRGLTRCDAVAVLVSVLTLAMAGRAVSLLATDESRRIVCGTILKGLGTAHTVYANDYEDAYAVQGGRGLNRWAANTPGWDNPNKNWNGDDDVTVGASLYLLVREVDVNPGSFVCPASVQRVFDGSNPNYLDFSDLWDFGSIDYRDTGPKNCVTYSYHHPYSGRFAPNGTRSASFAVMSDRNPWYDSATRAGEATSDDWSGRVAYLAPYWAIDPMEPWRIRVANAQQHKREGQNVLFGDGHSSYVEVSDVGVKHDNIFTPQAAPQPTNEAPHRIGQMPAPFGIGYGLPISNWDSFLVDDDEINPCTTDQPGDINGDCRVDMGDLAVLSEHWLESTRVEE